MKHAWSIAGFLNCDCDLRSEYGFSEDQAEALRRGVALLKQSPALLERAEGYYAALYASDTEVSKPTQLCDAEDEESGLLFAVLYLARLFYLPDVLSARGIPPRYASSAACRYRALLQRNFSRYGSYGFCGTYRDAVAQYLLPKTFTFGRLTFEMDTFRRYRTPYRVYQNQMDGRLMPLAKEGLLYLPEGKRCPPNEEDRAVLTTTQTEKDGMLSGYTFDENGRLIFDEIHLPSAIWKPILTEEDHVLWVHIPGTEPLTEECVSESLQMAKAFFTEYFPEKNVRAFACSSWLLDTSLQAYLKPSSNILAFQKRFRIVLSHVNPMALYFDVFHMEKEVPLSELVPQNRFQTEILDHMKAGGHLYSGNGFVFL